MVNSTLDIGREETKQRRILAKAFGSAIKERAKGTGWKVAQGVLFREFHGWFISAPSAVWLGERKTQIELHCKPMSLDPLFWEIVKAESNASMPLSFRYSGAWTCSTPPLVEYQLNENSGDAATIADEAVSWASAELVQFSSWSVDHFLSVLQQHPRANSFAATVVTTLLMSGDYHAAETLCREAIQRNDCNGFVIVRDGGPSQSFPELALAWIEKKRRSMH